MSSAGAVGGPAGIARHLEHTLLRPDAGAGEVETLCREAVQLNLLAVCVAPAWVRRAADCTAGSGVMVVTTCGFPFGFDLTSIKVSQAVTALKMGAAEVDMVVNLGAFKSGLLDRVRDDMAMVAEACHARGGRLKVILETGYLSDCEKVRVCELAAEAGADFVKTSTGFGPGGATVADVSLLRRSVPESVGVKAAGGIRDLATARRLLAAGASRLGTSAGAAIATAELEEIRKGAT